MAGWASSISGEVDRPQQNGRFAILGIVFVARLLLDRASPAVEGSKAGLFAAPARAEMIDQCLHRDRARRRRTAILAKEINDISS